MALRRGPPGSPRAPSLQRWPGSAYGKDAGNARGTIRQTTTESTRVITLSAVTIVREASCRLVPEASYLPPGRDVSFRLPDIRTRIKPQAKRHAALILWSR